MNWFNRSLKILKLRDHSEWEMRNKLKNKGANQEEVDLAIEELYKYNYINDLRFLEIYTRSRVNSSSDGKNIIKQKLLFQKHISQSLIDKHIDVFLDESGYNAYDRIERILARYDEDNRRHDDQKTKQKMWNKLKTKGYSSNEISSFF